MPELPEVEVLVRHLNCVLPGKRIRRVEVRREKVLGKSSPAQFSTLLQGARFEKVTRRAKYLLFHCISRDDDKLLLLGHLGMTGRMYLAPGDATLPKHAAVIFDLGPERFIFEDTRYFGRLTLENAALEKLGPE